MSLHNKPQSTALVEALIFHGLPYDTPSQLADAFRHGFNYQEARVLELRSKLEALNTGLEDGARKIAIEVAKNCETVPQLVFPHLYLGLKEFFGPAEVAVTSTTSL